MGFAYRATSGISETSGELAVNEAPIRNNSPMHNRGGRHCMNVSCKIVLIVACGFVVMHVSQLGWNSFVKQLPSHSPVITPGAARSFPKSEHRHKSQTLQRRGTVREMSSAVLADEHATHQVSRTYMSFLLVTRSNSLLWLAGS